MKNNLYSIVYSIRPAGLASFLSKFLRIRRKYVKTEQGYMFWVDPISHFGQQIIRHGIYERQMTQLLCLALRAGDVFIDVGAHEGYFSVVVSSLVKDGQVHCIEPQGRQQQVILENAKINNASAIRIHQIALSDKEKEVKLFLAPPSISGGSSLYARHKFWYHEEKVPSLTLDAFLKNNRLERVRLIKIDTEGAEHSIITGGIDAIRRRAIDFIALEYHPSILKPEKIISIHEVLKGAGYMLTKCRRQTIYHLKGFDKEIAGLGNLQVDAPI